MKVLIIAALVILCILIAHYFGVSEKYEAKLPDSVLAILAKLPKKKADKFGAKLPANYDPSVELSRGRITIQQFEKLMMQQAVQHLMQADQQQMMLQEQQEFSGTY
jgi:hypothetical protein